MIVSAILLAAGQSKRMGNINKLTKEINGVPLIKHSVQNILSSSIDELIIVLGFQKEIIEKIIGNNKKIKYVFNENFKNGISSSIKTGLNHISSKSSAFFICLGDMPMVSANIYDKLIKSLNDKEIVIPTFKDQQGNPVLFSISMKKKIMSLQGDIGAKKILELNKNKILRLETNDKNISLDFNTEDSFLLK